MEKNKKRKKQGIWKQVLAVCTASLMIAAVTGCSDTGIPIVSEVRENQGYSDAQAMIIITTEKNRYRETYGDEIWQVAVDSSGTTFQAYLLKEVHDYLDKWKLLNLLADEHQITLTSQEKEQLQKLSEAYFNGLTPDDIAYMGVVLEDISYMYEQYYRVNRVVDELTKDVNLDISDSEAKIITVQEIILSSENAAQAAYAQATAEGAEFAAVAHSYSEDPIIEKQIGRNERPKVYEDNVFNLEAGGISPIILDGETYYIVKCISEYDEEATLERKQQLALLRKDRAFRQIYDAFAAEHRIASQGAVWNKVSFTDDDNSTATNFFELYQEYMDSN